MVNSVMEHVLMGALEWLNNALHSSPLFSTLST